MDKRFTVVLNVDFDGTQVFHFAEYDEAKDFVNRCVVNDDEFIDIINYDTYRALCCGEEEEHYDIDDYVDESNYDPYCGCDMFE